MKLQRKYLAPEKPRLKTRKLQRNRQDRIDYGMGRTACAKPWGKGVIGDKEGTPLSNIPLSRFNRERSEKVLPQKRNGGRGRWVDNPCRSYIKTTLLGQTAMEGRRMFGKGEAKKMEKQLDLPEASILLTG